ncbi:hypothetical protein ABIF91_001603 [Bradyrhizobium sp. USDA 241]
MTADGRLASSWVGSKEIRPVKRWLRMGMALAILLAWMTISILTYDDIPIGYVR